MASRRPPDDADVAAHTVPADIHVVRTPPPRARPAVVVPGVLLGIGLGGFVDGIVLHQILRWHNMLSAVLPPTTMRNMGVNMVFDGYFHAVVWGITLLGVLGLWAAGRRGALFPTAGQFLGQLLFGWGLFNVVEGVVDHHVLQIHHVIDQPQHEPVFDWVFLAVSVGLLALGASLMRGRRRAVER
jgi:uncharacterized membrane protein